MSLVDPLQEDSPVAHGVPLGVGGMFGKLARYCRAHKRKRALIVVACAVETEFYWIVPLSFRHLIDNALQSPDRGSLLVVLLLLGPGSGVSSLASLWRRRYWAHVETQLISDIRFQLFHNLQHLSFSAYAYAAPRE